MYMLPPLSYSQCPTRLQRGLTLRLFPMEWSTSTVRCMGVGGPHSCSRAGGAVGTLLGAAAARGGGRKDGQRLHCSRRLSAEVTHHPRLASLSSLVFFLSSSSPSWCRRVQWSSAVPWQQQSRCSFPMQCRAQLHLSSTCSPSSLSLGLRQAPPLDCCDHLLSLSLSCRCSGRLSLSLALCIVEYDRQQRRTATAEAGTQKEMD